eukprot:6146009-Amphidinium_carterae.1
MPLKMSECYHYSKLVLGIEVCGYALEHITRPEVTIGDIPSSISVPRFDASMTCICNLKSTLHKTKNLLKIHNQLKDTTLGKPSFFQLMIPKFGSIACFSHKPHPDTVTLMLGMSCKASRLRWKRALFRA